MNFEYVYTFMQSNLLEVPVYWLFYRKRLGIGRTLLLVTLANAVTHPLVFFGFMGSRLSFLTSIVLAEIFAVVAETLLDRTFAQIPLGLAFVAALAANLFSWQLAPILSYFIFFYGR